MKLFHVDAFARRGFEGNPAAVVLLAEAAAAGWMQAVAAEMNLSETAFVVGGPGGGCYGLRWFTPTVEVDLCGHATLAAAAALYRAGWLAEDEAARFETRSGLLTVSRAGGGDSTGTGASASAGGGEAVTLRMDFPARQPEVLDKAAARSLGFDAATMLGEPAVRLAKAGDDLLVEVADAEAVRRLRPAAALLRRVPVRGVIVTAQADADADCDFISRFFAPAMGIEEDPVTGAAHCALGPYWARRLGRDTLIGYQASRRGGCVGVEVGETRIGLTGGAVVVSEGELLV